MFDVVNTIKQFLYNQSDLIELLLPILFITYAICWLVYCIFSIYSLSKPSKKIIEKYGKPYKHIHGVKGFHTLSTRIPIAIDMYSNFIVVSGKNSEILLNKDYKQFDLYGSYLISVLEIDNDGKKLQICLSRNDAKILREWFDSNK